MRDLLTADQKRAIREACEAIVEDDSEPQDVEGATYILQLLDEVDALHLALRAQS